ncbi:MAG: type IV secretion system DNA-binding domain-containing protein [Patescibacteria group bacterium]
MSDLVITPVGETSFRNHRRRFGIREDDRRRHMYLIGKTGMGKSTMLENMIIEDIRQGRGVGFVDPHGDTAEKILDFIPPNRINDVVYVNPADMEHPIAFNILETVDPRYKHLIASGLMGVFKKIWPDVWSARMEYILNNTILALLDYPGSTMLGVNRMLADRAYRAKVIEKIGDPVVKAFWVDEFARYNERYANEAIAPVQNKVGQFLSVALIRNIIGQVKSTINIREIMDTGKILILNLAKGRIGEDNSRLLGGMFITKIQLAAMERVDVPELERRDFYLYVDEFQNFATESFGNILSEARKYRLDLIVAHQYIEQLDEKVAAAVFGNVGTLISFRVGGADAETLVKEFGPRFIEEDLVNLPKFQYYIKLMIDGVVSEPFSAIGLAPLMEEERTNNTEKVIRVTRERYARPRTVVEDKITRWAQSIEPAPPMMGSRPSFPPRGPRPPQRDGMRGPSDRPYGNGSTDRPREFRDAPPRSEQRSSPGSFGPARQPRD